MSSYPLPVLLAVCLSCGPNIRGPHTGSKQWPMEATKDKTWDAVISVITGRGLTIQSLEKDSGVITTTPMTSRNESFFSDCRGGLDQVSHYEIRLALILREIPDGTSALTITTTSAVYKKQFLSVFAWASCPSSGVLEEELVRRIRNTLDIQDIPPVEEDPPH